MEALGVIVVGGCDGCGGCDGDGDGDDAMDDSMDDSFGRVAVIT